MTENIRSPVEGQSKVREVIRFDNIPSDQTYFTEEGYLIDNPIVTTCGIFEYHNADGTIRRELRLPEEVFKEESLASYEGKPVIETHDAGLITKDNVAYEEIGTILSKGYQDGNNVRAKIIIHETDRLKRNGARELSLGYKLTLDETPGTWNGQEYDAVQRNIVINHLAIVDTARAGENARLNIDSADKNILIGGKKAMSEKTKVDGEVATSEQNLPTAIEEVKEEIASKTATEETADTATAEPTPAPVAEEPATDDKVAFVKDRRDRRDSAGAPATLEEALVVLNEQKEDIDSLIDYIEAGNAKADFDAATEGEGEQTPVTETKTDGEENAVAGQNEDCGESVNMDAVERIVAQKLELARFADKLNLDGVERMSILDGKKAIIRHQKPTIRLDGKSVTYINAMFDLVKDAFVQTEKTAQSRVDDQRAQMFNKDSAETTTESKGGAAQARERMLARRNGGK